MASQESIKKYVLDNLMDTIETKAKFKILRSLNGKISNDGHDILYSVLFIAREGVYNPIIVFDNSEIAIVRNRYTDLVNEIRDYDELDDSVKPNSPKPTYDRISYIPEIERYQYFRYKGVKYKFSFSVFWNDTLDICGLSNDAFDYILNKNVFTKAIYDDARNQISLYYFHPFEYEIDVMSAYVFLSYIYELLGRVIYLTFFGAPGTGKTYGLEILKYLLKNGFITGMGTIPSTVRNIEFHQISLCQDEFEKMGRDERVKFTGIMNAGFNPNKKYNITNVASKDVTRQTVGFRSFCPKCFTANSLYGFDMSFQDRLYVINSVKANKNMKDIYQLTHKELDEFQGLRDKTFVYVFSNWREMLKDIDDVKQSLVEENIFGRDNDKMSIILGIIQHFKGEDYANKVKEYIKNKTPLEKIERAQSMEEIILTALVDIYAKHQEPLIVVDNHYLYNLLLVKLQMNKTSKGAPGDRKPGRILKSLGLTPKKENLGYTQSGSRRYKIHLKDLEFVLNRDGYENLSNKLIILSSPSSLSSLSETTGATGATKATKASVIKGKNIDWSLQ